MLFFHQLHDWLYHYDPAEGIPLKGTGIAVGLALLGAHLFAYFNPDGVKSFLKAFPRSYFWGVVLLTLALGWSLMCLSFMDMGEFHTLRDKFTMAVVIGYALVVVYVKEFLSVRALGALLLLVAGIVLQAAFLQPQTSRLLLPILAYAWIVAGMYFVGMPYLLRDGIDWVTQSAGRWNTAVWAGVGYGAVTLTAALLWW